jgi:hypothetical protein
VLVDLLCGTGARMHDGCGRRTDDQGSTECRAP